jgi:hypothetical protein
MAEVVPLPNPGGVFADARGGDRGMRVSYHQEAGILVISLWSGRQCRATFQLMDADVTRLSTLLAAITAESGPTSLAS